MQKTDTLSIFPQNIDLGLQLFKTFERNVACWSQ